MKKILFIAIAFILVLTACNRKSFVKKITGTWKFSSYSVAGQDQTLAYDTVNKDYQLVINESDVYAESWKNYNIKRDSFIRADTLSVDTNTSPYTYDIKLDTLRYWDTTVTLHAGSGKWSLINSEEDLQLRDDSDLTNPRIYRILKLDAKSLNLSKGNQELHLKK